MHTELMIKDAGLVRINSDSDQNFAFSFLGSIHKALFCQAGPNEDEPLWLPLRSMKAPVGLHCAGMNSYQKEM